MSILSITFVSENKGEILRNPLRTSGSHEFVRNQVDSSVVVKAQVLLVLLQSICQELLTFQMMRANFIEDWIA